MNTLDMPLGWLFLTIGVIFSLGLSPCWVRRFYPSSPAFRTRLAAPILSAALAAACFLGRSLPALAFVAAAGITLIIVPHRKRRFTPTE